MAHTAPDLTQRYLERLAELYPSIAEASTEIINLQAILSLPKGTEHFITDIHGEYEAFSHVLKNGSGSVKKKIDDVFGRTLAAADKNQLATVIYYPQEKMNLVRRNCPDMTEWYRITLYRLIEVCKQAASKYTRSKVRKALPKDFAYVIEELITEKAEVLDKEAYYNAIVDTIIDTGRAEPFIVAMSELIQRLVVDRLHILGDIFDRGPGPDRIMDKLLTYHALDIVWGNHDIVWMGAAAGSLACLTTVLRNSARYDNLDILEDGYGINLLPLASFASRTYAGDPCALFRAKRGRGLTAAGEGPAGAADGGFPSGEQVVLDREQSLNAKIHKAVAVMQFKAEGQLIAAHPEFHMEDRRLLHRIDYEQGTITLEGNTYQLLDKHFPTIDPGDPYAFTPEEEAVLDRLQTAFMQCEKLHRHVDLLLRRGSLYRVYNNNLLYHGCMPLDEEGNFLPVEIYGNRYSGRALYDVLEAYVRKAFFAERKADRLRGRDMLWYLWSSPESPLFGKNKMATFERYFLAEPETHKEQKNPYYRLIDNEQVMDRVLAEFGLTKDGHIVNGHVPVLQGAGESPLHCGGKVLIIDGGFSKAYQKKTGIAGYTLIYNSYGMMLVAHNPFTSTEDAIRSETDIRADRISVMSAPRRLSVGDTDNGRAIKERIAELRALLAAYRSGRITERA